MSRRALWRALAACLCAAPTIGLAGCGSGALSDRQLHSRATAICKRASARTDRIASPAMPSGSARFLSAGIAAIDPELTALRRLHAPGDMADDYRDALSASGAELAALRSSLHGLRAGDDAVTAIKSLQQQLEPAEARAQDAWSALHLPACQEAT
ncbi:MAG: hypothetical protein JOZ07_09315 [Solirubrobacterales bacterium]|nr:hypothetical protein [Solirubrobacterales bacterium]